MSPQELEDIFIKSLDTPMMPAEKEMFLKALHENPSMAKQFEEHKKIRDLIRSNEETSFGPYFSTKLIYKIQNTGVVVDRQIFTFFRKFQLAAVGVVVALLILNMVFAEQGTLTSIIGLDNTISQDEQIVSFDFYDTLNK